GGTDHRRLSGPRLRGADHDPHRRCGRRSGQHHGRVLGEPVDRDVRDLRQSLAAGGSELRDLRGDGRGPAVAFLGQRRRGARMTVSEVIAPPRQGAPVWGLWTSLALAITALALAPAIGLPSFAQSLVIETLIFSILALSLDILLGFTGLVSFGHAAFFGVGGYAMAIAATRLTPDL